MSSIGAIKVINVQNRPQLISLCTRSGTQCDSTLNDVTWTMRDSIGVIDQNFTAVISLYSMAFYSSFANIVEGANVLKVLSTFTVTNGSQENYTQLVTIPPGQYSIDALIAYLNTAGTCNGKKPGDTTYVYGLGVSGNATYPPFAVSTADPSKLVVQAPTAGTGVLGTVTAAHTYTGFFLIVDATTIPLMNQLGLIENNQSNRVTNTQQITSAGASYSVIGFTPIQIAGSPNRYTYNSSTYPTTIVQGKLTAGNNIDLGGPLALAVSWENMYANTRNSCDQLSIGDTIAIVPVLGAYGYKNVFQPPIAFKSVIPNFNINQFNLKVRDAATGLPVDFQGSDWLVTLCIEFYEIENNYMSETGQSGIGRNVMPLTNSAVMNHNLPFSGTAGYQHTHPMDNGYNKRTKYA